MDLDLKYCHCQRHILNDGLRGFESEYEVVRGESTMPGTIGTF